MANILIVGNTLVQPEEYSEKKQLGDLDELNHAVKNQGSANLSFSTGDVSTAEIMDNFKKLSAPFESTGNAPNPFIEIGLGKPVCVEILTIYTGDYPNGLFGGRKDLMLSSAIKSSVTFDAAARAINKVDRKPNEKTYVEFLASEPGTRVVYYTPAVDALNTDITFELVADTFEQEFFEQVSKLLKAAAGIPLFMPAASFLLGGSHLIKLAGGLGNTALAKKAYLRDNYELKFNNAGDFDSIARSMVICNDGDEGAFDAYEARLLENNGRTKFRLVHRQTGETYNGEAPYLIINLDGQIRDDLASFTPKLASTAILQKFYGEDDVQGVITNTIEQAMQLYNDMNYKQKAERLSKVLKQLPEGSDERKKNEALLQAYLKNIQSDFFKD
jgi:hypothetical protein